MQASFTREIAAISFTVASFQIARVKRREARRSPKKPKKWRKTVARSSPKGADDFTGWLAPSNFPEQYLAQNN
jgi:hypothetical protein